MCVCLPIKYVAILTITMDRCVIKAGGCVHTRLYTALYRKRLGAWVWRFVCWGFAARNAWEGELPPLGEWAHGCATMGGAGARMPGHGARRHGAKGRWAHLETSHEEERLKGNNKRGERDTDREPSPGDFALSSSLHLKPLRGDGFHFEREGALLSTPSAHSWRLRRLARCCA